MELSCGQLAAPIAALACAMVLGCGGVDVQHRLVSIHNTLTAMGLAQTGSISEGSLESGAEARLPVELEAGRCYTFLVLGSGGADNVDVRLLTSGNDRKLGEDDSVGTTAAIHVCPDAAGTYELVVRMAGSAGDYLVSSFSGVGGGAVAAGSGSPRTGNSCASVEPLTFDAPINGDTSGSVHTTSGTCAQGDAPERVYSFELTERMQFTARVEANFDSSLYVVGECGRRGSEIACNDDAGGANASMVSLALDAGSYFLVVDGYSSESGRFELKAQLREAMSLEQLCNAAQLVTPGQDVSGDTAGGLDNFQASCAENARSPDEVYKINVSEPSRLRVRQQSVHDGALHVRSSCQEQSSELGCNDDYLTKETSVLTAVIGAGDAYLITDGYKPGEGGSYSFRAEIAPAQGDTSTPGSTCQNAIRIGDAGAGQAPIPDTFRATDNFTGTCGGAAAPDVAYTLRVARRSSVRVAVVGAEFAGVVYIQKRCGEEGSEVRCMEFPDAASAEQPRTMMDVVLAAGTYTVVVDGKTPTSFGAVTLGVALQTGEGVDSKCSNAPELRSGQLVTGTTVAFRDDFHATCADGTASPDTVYKFRLRRAGMVKIDLKTQGFDGALHLRRDCGDAGSELACNDDWEEDRALSRIQTTLPAGKYYVIVDGYDTEQAGAYTLQADF